jgi:hypothetical protein
VLAVLALEIPSAIGCVMSPSSAASALLPRARQAVTRKVGASTVVGRPDQQPSSLPAGWSPVLPATGVDGPVRRPKAHRSARGSERLS